MGEGRVGGQILTFHNPNLFLTQPIYHPRSGTAHRLTYQSLYPWTQPRASPSPALAVLCQSFFNIIDAAPSCLLKRL